MPDPFAVVGDVIASDRQRKATNQALSAEEAAAARADATQRYFYDTSRGDMLPFMEGNSEAMALLKSGIFGGPQMAQRSANSQMPSGYVQTDFDPEYSLGQRNQDISGLESALQGAEGARTQVGQMTLADIARLVSERNAAPGKFNYQADPGFEFMQNEQNRVMNQQLGNRGKYFSGRAVDEVLGNGNQRLIGAEYDKLYNRYLGEADSRYGRGLNLAGMKFGEADNNLNLATSRYGRNYGDANTKYGLGLDKVNQKYGRLIDLAKIGQGSAGTAGQWGMNTGSSLANIYQGLGTNQANAALARGQIGANLSSGLGRATGEAAQMAIKAFGFGG